MIAYTVEIPPPSAKRLTVREFSVSYGDVWNGMKTETVSLGPDQAEAAFALPDEYEYARMTAVIDGPAFDVWVDSYNTSRSRHERRHLLPVRK